MLKQKSIEVVEASCEKCKYIWIVRTETPKRCPNCKRPDWNKVGKK